MSSRLPTAPARPGALLNATGASVLLAAAGLAASAGAAAADAPGWQVSGDLRGGYFASERTARDGAESDDEAFNARLRVAIDGELVDLETPLQIAAVPASLLVRAPE